MTQPQTNLNKQTLRRIGFAAAALLVVANLAILGWLIVKNRSVDNAAIDAQPTPTVETAPEPTEAPQPAPTATAEQPATPTPVPPTATPTTAPDVEPTPTADVEPTPTETAPTATPEATYPPLDSLPERGAIYRAPILTLEGPVQDQQTVDAVIERAAAIVGLDNIDNQYVIHPAAPPFTNGNVTVESAVLFQTGSAEIADDFASILGLGVAVMVTFPQVEMIVEGHTDSVGPADTNQVLSERRAQAIIDYIVANSGTPLERFEAQGFGETQPVATNDTALGRQANRRIEVQLLNLLAQTPDE